MAKRLGAPEREIGELRIKRLCELLEVGLFVSEACRAIGIKPDHVRKWLLRAEDGEEDCAAFGRRVRDAEAKLVEEKLRKIGLSDDYRAHTWFMERRFPKVWGNRAEDNDGHSAAAVEDMRGTLAEKLEAVLGRASGDS